MGVLQLLALLASALPGRVFGVFASRRIGGATVAWAYGSAVTLAISFVAFEVEFERIVVAVRPPSVAAGLPMHFLVLHAPPHAPAAEADALLALVLCGALAFAVFLRFIGTVPLIVRLSCVGALIAVMAGAALALPVSGSSDPYLYAGLAMLGTSAYAPPATPFAGELRAINVIWGTPLLPSAYGPVWIALSSALLAPLPTLASKLFALKLLGFVSLLACAILARRLGAEPVVVAGIACNPALYVLFVGGAHNDLLAVDFVLAAMVAARRSVVAAFVFTLGATLVKLTLAPIALVVTIGFAPLRTRIRFACVLAIVVVAIYATNGAVMVHALLIDTAWQARPRTGLEIAFRVVLSAIALANGIYAVAVGRVRPQTAWTPPAFADTQLPWYEVWGLPLALTSTPVALTYLASLPFLWFFENDVFAPTHALGIAAGMLVFAACSLAAYRLRATSCSCAAPKSRCSRRDNRT